MEDYLEQKEDQERELEKVLEDFWDKVVKDKVIVEDMRNMVMECLLEIKNRVGFDLLKKKRKYSGNDIFEYLREVLDRECELKK